MPDIFELKHEGHGLIDELVMLGIPRYKVYQQLKCRLKVPDGYEHFARMSTISQVQKAITVLRDIKRARKSYLKRRREKEIRLQPKKIVKPDVLPLEDQRRLIAEVAIRNQERRVPLMLRIWRMLTT